MVCLLEGILRQLPEKSRYGYGKYQNKRPRERRTFTLQQRYYGHRVYVSVRMGRTCGVSQTEPDFDLTQHINTSNQDLSYVDSETGEKYVPFVIEPSLGADRVALAFLIDAYDEEVLTDSNGKEDVRTVLKFHPALAPFKAAVLPLAKKLSPVAEPIHEELSKYFMTDYDASGSIGKRYRREDEIGTPFCICVDFDTQTDGCVTVRDRDTMEQVRIPVDQVRSYIEERLSF